MNWEAINGITGIISAMCAIGSISYFGTHKPATNIETQNPIITVRKFMSFILAFSGWVLCCLSFLWVAEPYGSYPNDNEYQQFFGVILAFPALVIFLFGLNILSNEKT